MEDDNNGTPTLQDIVKRLPPIKLKGKIKSSSLVLGKTGELRVSISNSNTNIISKIPFILIATSHLQSTIFITGFGDSFK